MTSVTVSAPLHQELSTLFSAEKQSETVLRGNENNAVSSSSVATSDDRATTETSVVPIYSDVDTDPTVLKEADAPVNETAVPLQTDCSTVQDNISVPPFADMQDPSVNTKAQGIDSLVFAIGNMAEDSRSKGRTGKESGKYRDELNQIIGVNQNDEKISSYPQLKTQAAYDEILRRQSSDTGSLVEIAFKIRQYLEKLDDYCRSIIVKSSNARQNDAQTDINRTREIIDDLVYSASAGGRKNNSPQENGLQGQVEPSASSLTTEEINSLLKADSTDSKEGSSDAVYADGHIVEFDLTAQQEPETGEQALEKARNMALEQERLSVQVGRDRLETGKPSLPQESEGQNLENAVNDTGYDDTQTVVSDAAEPNGIVQTNDGNSTVSDNQSEDLPPLPDEADITSDDEDSELTLPDEQLIPADFYDRTGEQNDSQIISDPENGVIKDGNPQNVPHNQRTVIQKLTSVSVGRRQVPDDYIPKVVAFDPWYQDIIRAGYTEGPIHSALTFSVRKIDPQNKYHWIVVMSDHFQLFIQDPQFVHNITTKFSFMYGHALEINVQVYRNKEGTPHYPEESPYGLACREFRKAIETAKSSFFADKALAQFMLDQGQTPDSVNITLYADNDEQ